MAYDVIVVGSGNAGFCAAHAAAEEGARVLIVEKASEEWAGGNTYFTQGSFRTTLTGVQDIRHILHDRSDERLDSTYIPPYEVDDFRADMEKATRGRSDERLTDILCREARPTIDWLYRKGIRWELSYDRRSFWVDGQWKFFGGGAVRVVGQGKGLIAQHRAAAKEGDVEVQFDSPVVELLVGETHELEGVVCESERGLQEYRAASVVLASGGFGANAAWRASYLGPNWDLASVRGTPCNTGDGHSLALGIGAQAAGHWSGCHAVSWDAEARKDRGDRELTNALTRSSYMLGLVVNRLGQRFLDEGADIRTMTYAIYGARVLEQPDALGYHIFDNKTRNLLNPEYEFTAGAGPAMRSADTLEELAEALGIHPDGLVSTVNEFNESVLDGAFDPSRLDGKSTSGLEPPKSNWALPLDEPPYFGCRVTCGITFTYGGLAVDETMSVVGRRGYPIPGLFAAGEIVGGLFFHNYPGGAGLTAGAVFGRAAGRAAAAHALHDNGRRSPLSVTKNIGNGYEGVD